MTSNLKANNQTSSEFEASKFWTALALGWRHFPQNVQLHTPPKPWGRLPTQYVSAHTQRGTRWWTLTPLHSPTKILFIPSALANSQLYQMSNWVRRIQGWSVCSPYLLTPRVSFKILRKLAWCRKSLELWTRTVNQIALYRNDIFNQRMTLDKANSCGSVKWVRNMESTSLKQIQRTLASQALHDKQAGFIISRSLQEKHGDC